jgi:hypothetical protein
MARKRDANQDGAQMGGISCEMCLQADEPTEMVAVDVARPDGAVIRTAMFCHRCVAAILIAARDVVAAQPEEEPDDEPDTDNS